MKEKLMQHVIAESSTDLTIATLLGLAQINLNVIDKETKIRNILEAYFKAGQQSVRDEDLKIKGFKYD